MNKSDSAPYTEKKCLIVSAQGTISGQNYFTQREEWDDGEIKERNFILTDTGWKETNDIPKGNESYFHLPDKQSNVVEIKSLISSDVVAVLSRIETFKFYGGLVFDIKSEDRATWEFLNRRLEGVLPTKEDINLLLAQIHSLGGKISLKSLTEFIDFLQSRKTSKTKLKLFKDINEETELGVSRIMSDRVYHLHKLLEKLELSIEKANNYSLRAEADSSSGIIGLEYFFIASSDQEAQKIASMFKEKLVGGGERLWLACWDVAIEAGALTFEVDTMDLYRKCHPDRKANPSSEERKDFFNLIRLLEKTKLLFTRKIRKCKKPPITLELPILFIRSSTDNSKGWPRRLNLQVLMPEVEDSMAFIATPIQKNTLRLMPKDIHLATMLQTKRSQHPSENTISFTLKDLIEGGGLLKTYNVNSAEAKKLLRAKLSRFKVLGIIKSFPSKFPSALNQKVEIVFFERNKKNKLEKLGV